MNINLITQYYKCPDGNRQKEIDYCLEKNLINPAFQCIHILSEENFDFSAFPNNSKISQTVISKRLTFEQAFKYANGLPSGSTWVLANADIFFDDTINLVVECNLEKAFFALTRHDVQKDGTLTRMAEEYAHGSHDAWIFKTPLSTDGLVTDFFLGIPGCDNKIVYEFIKAGFRVSNPSDAIIVHHVDMTRQLNTEARVRKYFEMTIDENVTAGVVAPTPYLGEIYPTSRLDLATSQHSDIHYKVLRDFAEHVRYISDLRKQVASLKKQMESSQKEYDAQLQAHRDVIATLYASLSWKVTAPLRHLQAKMVPQGSRRRLFFFLLSRLVSQPKQFMQCITLPTLIDFCRQLWKGDPQNLQAAVATALHRRAEELHDEGQCNDYLLKVATNTVQNRLSVKRTQLVDVLIPIYNAYELTKDCLASVLANSENCRLILVNDASTDERIRPMIEAVAAIPERGIEIICQHNEQNLGFVQTVNSAYSLTRGHFVILNSDTEVPPGWLDRLFDPIFSSPNSIASVTPFSNAGMDCSFPNRDVDNPIFCDLSVSELDNYFKHLGSSVPLDLFTGVGFCMAFNRSAVEQVGLFDADTFGKGYGEEADWSLRAFEAGWRNVLAPNVFVYHKHGGSFPSEEKLNLMERNLAKFWDRYRSHFGRYREYKAADTMRSVRDSLAIGIDALSDQAYRVAILDVDLVGGGSVYSDWLKLELRARGMTTIHIKWNVHQKLVKVLIESEKVHKNVVLPMEAASEVSALLSFLHVSCVLVNELFSWPYPNKVMAQLSERHVPYLVFIHDFFMVCPTWFLINSSGNFCDIPKDTSICKDCLSSNDFTGHHNIYGTDLDDIARWRSDVAGFLANSERIICFATSTRDYLHRVFPQLQRIEVQGHAIPNHSKFMWGKRQFEGGRLNVALIGSLHHIKGERIVTQLLDEPGFRSLPLTITLFGHSPAFPAGFRSNDGKFFCHGSYLQHELPTLLEKHEIHAVLILSILPETFSYTTSESILLGYPVICFDLGAQAERVKKNRCGITIAEVSAGGVVDALRHLIECPHLIEEFSDNARSYKPASPEEHFGAIARFIDQAVNPHEEIAVHQ